MRKELIRRIPPALQNGISRAILRLRAVNSELFDLSSCAYGRLISLLFASFTIS